MDKGDVRHVDHETAGAFAEFFERVEAVSIQSSRVTEEVDRG